MSRREETQLETETTARRFGSALIGPDPDAVRDQASPLKLTLKKTTVNVPNSVPDKIHIPAKVLGSLLVLCSHEN